METGIYIELSANDPRERSRSWGYVLEAPGGKTKHDTGECTSTMHGATLQTLIKALGRYHQAESNHDPRRGRMGSEHAGESTPGMGAERFPECAWGTDQVSAGVGAAGRKSKRPQDHDRAGTA